MVTETEMDESQQKETMKETEIGGNDVLYQECQKLISLYNIHDHDKLLLYNGQRL